MKNKVKKQSYGQFFSPIDNAHRNVGEKVLEIASEEFAKATASIKVQKMESVVSSFSSFAKEQPYIQEYLTSDHSGVKLDDRAFDLLQYYAAQLCSVLKARMGWIPMLTTQKLMACEAIQSALFPGSLANKEPAQVLEKVVQHSFQTTAKTGVFGAMFKEASLKLTSIAICFAAAYGKEQTQGRILTY
jgi:hypothetical protein